MDRKLALVTGASAGIGAAFARHLAARGYDLALTARRADRLEALAAELKQAHGADSLIIPADLADAAAPAAIAEAVLSEGRTTDVLINNAGYGLTGAFMANTWADHAAFIQVMVTAPCDLAHRVAGGMAHRRFGRIVNVASLAGLIPSAAGHTLYAASKAFLIKASQSLHLELAGQGVHVTALCPGFTWSEFHDVNGTRARADAAIPRWMWTSAEHVVAAGWSAVEANRPTCVPGAASRAVASVAKVIPDGLALAAMRSLGPRLRAT